MKIDCPSPLEQMDSHYQAIVVGGGATGAGVFRDLSLHGVHCLLVERGDFASETSWASSKMLHGGIRYLEQCNFALVWEALTEKNLWIKLAPHLCSEHSFYLPIYKGSKYPLWMLRMGLWGYDFLSGFQNKPYQILSSKETQRALTGIREENLRGAGVYHDVVVDDCKLVLENIYDALLMENAHAANYTEVQEVERKENNFQLTLQDRFTGQSRRISTSELIVATGPFTDRLLGKWPIPWRPKLMTSKGSHLWLRRSCLSLSHPMVVQTRDMRLIFVVPHSYAILVGTTEKVTDEDPARVSASEEEIDYLLEEVRKYFPQSKISRQDILGTFSGVRPLVAGHRQDSGQVSRRHHIFQPCHNLHVILGGKLTTFRVMGQEVSKRIIIGLGRSYDRGLSASYLRAPSLIYNLDQIPTLSYPMVEQIVRQEQVRTKDDLIRRRLGLWSPGLWNHAQDFETFFQGIEINS